MIARSPMRTAPYRTSQQRNGLCRALLRRGVLGESSHR